MCLQYATSIVAAGGYEDDKDDGHELVYTGKYTIHLNIKNFYVVITVILLLQSLLLLSSITIIIIIITIIITIKMYNLLSLLF